MDKPIKPMSLFPLVGHLLTTSKLSTINGNIHGFICRQCVYIYIYMMIQVETTLQNVIIIN